MLLLQSPGTYVRLKLLAGTARRALLRFSAWCARCYARAEQRRALADLDPRMLKDIGVTPSQARAECAKPWWRE